MPLSEEMKKLVMVIKEKGNDELAAIVAESGDDVEDDVMHAWQKDVSSCHEFFQDQLKNHMLQIIFYCPSLSLSSLNSQHVTVHQLTHLHY